MLVSGPFEHPEDAAFPGVKRYRAWLRWYDDRTGWRTHMVAANPHVVRRYWQHAGYDVQIWEGQDHRLEASTDHARSQVAPVRLRQ